MLTEVDRAHTDARDPPSSQPIVVSQRVRTGRPGRPRVEIDPTFLTVASRLRGPTHLTSSFQCSARTIQRRQIEYGIREPQPPPRQRIVLQDGTVVVRHTSSTRPYSTMTDEELFAFMQACLIQFGNHGYQMADGYLRGQGYSVQRRRVNEAIYHIRGVPAFFGNRRVGRRVYRVKGPNSLWHHDGQHGELKYLKWSKVSQTNRIFP